MGGEVPESPVKCPHCPDYVLPGDEMARHMQARHPEILEQLMKESMQQLGLFFG